MTSPLYLIVASDCLSVAAYNSSRLSAPVRNASPYASLASAYSSACFVAASFASVLFFSICSSLPSISATLFFASVAAISASTSFSTLSFSFLIKKFDFKTPGREDDDTETKLYTKADVNARKEAGKETAGNTGAADPVSEAITQGLGGKKNISDVDCCATRLRITVHDAARVNDEIIKTTGSRGIVKKGQGVQIIYGPQVTVIKSKLEDYLETAPDEYYESAVVSEENSAEENTDTVNENNETREKVVNTIVVSSPITGMAGDITTCPDEGFAGKMMGDGAVVTPEDAVICAPEDGEVLFVFETKHALGFQTESGLGMLLHIGIDTVSLNGEGFEVFVENGQKVKKGDPLMKIDIPFLASHAPSLCS